LPTVIAVNYKAYYTCESAKSKLLHELGLGHSNIE